MAICQVHGQQAVVAELPGTDGLPTVTEGMDAGHPVLRHPARQALYRLVRSNWGIWETELGRLSSLGRSNVKYHLVRLVRARLIQARPQGRKVHYFPRDIHANDLQKAIVTAQDGTRRTILHLIRDQPQMSWRAISRVVGITPRAMRWHMHRLAKDGLIEVERDGMYCRARLTPILEAVLNGDVEMLSRNLPNITIGPSLMRRAPPPIQAREEARPFVAGEPFP